MNLLMRKIAYKLKNLKPVFTRTIISSCLMLGLLCASGCVTTPHVNLVQPVSKGSPQNESEGLLVVRIVNAGNIALPLNYITISPKNLNESEAIKPIRLEALGKTTGGTSVFASYVPSGEYSISNARAFHSNGQVWYSRWVNTSVELGTFNVSVGQVTDLGSLVYYSRVLEDKFNNVLLRSPVTPEGGDIKALLPFIDYAQQDVSHWNDDGLEEERLTSYTSAAQNPTKFNHRLKAPDGSIYFLGKLGVILKRDDQKEWSLEAVDTDFDLTAIAVNQRQDIAVGGEFGHLFIKPNGQNWKSIQLNPTALVEHLAFHSSDQLDVVLREPKKVTVLRGNINSNTSNWEELASFTPAQGWSTIDKPENEASAKLKTATNPGRAQQPKLISAVYAQEVNNIHYIFLRIQTGSSYSVFNKSERLDYTYEPDTWQAKKSKRSDGIDYVLKAGDVDIGVKKPGFWSWTTKDAYFRFDKATDAWEKIATRVDFCPGLDRNARCKRDGKPIRRYKNFDFISIPSFKDANEGYAIVSFPQRDTTKPSYKRIIKTLDGGKAWSVTDYDTPHEHCLGLIPEVTESLLVSCNGISSDFYESSGIGEEWEHVREHENF